jgi:hypothetical protein
MTGIQDVNGGKERIAVLRDQPNRLLYGQNLTSGRFVVEHVALPATRTAQLTAPRGRYASCLTSDKPRDQPILARHSVRVSRTSPHLPWRRAAMGMLLTVELPLAAYLELHSGDLLDQLGRLVGMVTNAVPQRGDQGLQGKLLLQVCNQSLGDLIQLAIGKRHGVPSHR